MSAPAITTNLSAHDDAKVAEPVSPGSKSSKRSFFGLGKKKKGSTVKEKEQQQPDSESPAAAGAEPAVVISEKAPQLPELIQQAPMDTRLPDSVTAAAAAVTSPSSLSPKFPPSASPILAPRPTSAPYSTSSPRALSTSSSMIFERNVQEHPNNPHLPVPTSPAIPAHIQTENHIPPVLEASSLAITDRNCGVDEVEIVMHSAHQPAVLSVSPSSSAYFSSLPDHIAAAASSAETTAEEFADRRRLSFISFADVVQAEQAEQFSDVLTQHSSSSSPASRGSPVQSAVDPIAISTINERLRRSPSPIRLGNSPPGSGYGGSGIAAPSSPDSLGAELPQQQRGELTIETMRQALRKTGSGDLGMLAQRSPIAGSFNR
ncbi:hypothetical protein FN846DRAFT_103059 [Sphaerosporella brunnea]|uniref:Uncharacterized protein n=1 Tax=Sphaerosporella brunnea TaxID=1250544 RepID=A0A5J5F9C9_9PEZI|nr:hypothetical protein FN846DRAFT_103059 [Sphaerosporella brunnea]